MTRTPPPATLELERRPQVNKTSIVEDAGQMTVMLSPIVNEGYWAYRVKLTETQAVVGFPKFTTIGIGFAREDADWNTNLPYTEAPYDIVKHIWTNHGDSIPDDDVVWFDTVAAAVAIIQNAVYEDGGPA